MKHEPIEVEELEPISVLLKKSKTDDGTFIDALYNLYFFIQLYKSNDDLKNGRYMTLEESKERMRKKYESYNARYGS
mgnify:CR=1 FL=1